MNQYYLAGRTWLNTALYYSKHYVLIKQVIMELNRDDPTSIGKMQDLTVDRNLEYNNLAYIKSNFDSSRRFHSNFGKFLK